MAVSANAATITYSSTSLNLTPTNFTSAVSVPLFNPSLGTLTGVDITINGSDSVAVTSINPTGSPQTANVLAGTTLILERPDTSTLLQDFMKQFFTTPLAPGPGTFATNSSAISQSASTGVLIDASDLALFTGVGNLSLPVLGQDATSVNLPSFYGGDFAEAALSGNITYTYSPSGGGGGGSTPEPSSLALVGLGLGAAGLMRRARLRK